MASSKSSLQPSISMVSFVWPSLHSPFQGQKNKGTMVLIQRNPVEIPWNKLINTTIHNSSIWIPSQLIKHPPDRVPMEDEATPARRAQPPFQRCASSSPRPRPNWPPGLVTWRRTYGCRGSENFCGKNCPNGLLPWKIGFSLDQKMNPPNSSGLPWN